MLHPAIRQALEAELRRHQDLEQMLADPAVSSNPARFRELAREAGRLLKRRQRFEELSRLEAKDRELRQLATDADADLRSLAEEELAHLAPELQRIELDLQSQLLSEDELSSRNIILEVRAGTGGDEASLFAADLVRMYQRFAERRHFKVEELSSSRSDVGGFKEWIGSIEGASVYSLLRWESGGHRVQRVPSTESQGRIHTSAATVAVLPEPEEVEVEVKDADLRIDTYRAGGPGGQKVNKTSSAVRLTHLPTGLVVCCQDETSQHKNKAKAMRTLRTRLFDLQQGQIEAQRAKDRRSQIGTGDRSEKIRTYNFPQDRLTDHRIKESFHNLAAIMDGDLEEMIEAMRKHSIGERLEALSQGKP